MRAVGVEVVAGATAKVVDADATQAVPVERRADCVVLVSNEHGENTDAFVVEVQLAVDPDKLYSWPLNLAAVHSRYRCRSRLVVLTMSEDVAAWAERPIDSFHERFAPVVIGPRQIPRVERLEDALRSPGLAMLSATVHGGEPGGDDIVLAALAGAGSLASATREHYTDLLELLLSCVTPKVLEEWMSFHGYELQGPTFKRKVAEAEVNAARRFVRSALEARGVALSAVGLQRLTACTDFEQLERWHRAAVIGAKSELEE